jgi:cell division protein FtsI (penicillin-binding protein 3)
MTSDKDINDKLKTSKILWYMYWGFILASIVLIIQIIHLKVFWEPRPTTEHYFRPRNRKEILKPERGAILDHNGKLIAVSTPMYNIAIDCTVMKESYARDKEEGKQKEKEWKEKACRLAQELPAVLAKDGKDAAYYRKLILDGRSQNKQYVPITKGIDHNTLMKLKTLPLFNQDKNTGGLIVERMDTRQYPYKSLARSVVGYVRNNEDTGVSKRRGIESKYDQTLHGTEGLRWKRITDNKGTIQDTDSAMVAVVNGNDVRTTLDIDIQDIADRALRRQIESEMDIDGGCVIIMDVKTGAIRAMVNLNRGSNGTLDETYNLAIARAGEPGSVMKTATLMTLLEDGLIRLDDEIETNHGKMKNVKDDETIKKYERNNKTDKIPVIDGFKLSSNYVFRYLVKEHYGKKPEEYLARLYEYKLADAFDFELEGFAKATLPDTKSKTWSPTDLIQVAIGYSATETPLHIVTFYNAIANKGKMMKPYLVESIEKEGDIIERFKPEILNGAICSKATADTLLRALKTVTSEGTGTKVKNARCKVAGKTGTAWVVMDPKYTEGRGGVYKDSNGRKQYQGTFVGFFPADEPKYSAIITIWSKPTLQSFHGGTLPALAMKEIVDNTYALDCEWGEEIEKRGRIPEMEAEEIYTDNEKGSPVPSVTGYGLKDALYAIENSGYRCVYEGCGHVVRQSPKAGTPLTKGQTVKIILR